MIVFLEFSYLFLVVEVSATRVVLGVCYRSLDFVKIMCYVTSFTLPQCI